MGLKEDLICDLETARRDFHHLLDSVPEAAYVHPSRHPNWTVGDVLYHITLGPPFIRGEIWLLCHATGLLQFVMNDFTARIFNWGNALFARHPKRITRQRLLKAYEAGHAGLVSGLRRLREEDFAKSVTYPQSFVAELAGEVTVERLVQYLVTHLDVHAEEIKAVGRDGISPYNSRGGAGITAQAQQPHAARQEHQ
jgi:hypothetical protein